MLKGLDGVIHGKHHTYTITGELVKPNNPESVELDQTFEVTSTDESGNKARVERFVMQQGHSDRRESLVKPSLRDRGRRSQEIASLLEAQIKEGQNFSYGLASDIRDQLVAAEVQERKAKLDDSHSPTLLLENGFARDEGELDLP